MREAAPVAVARELAEEYAALPEVSAVALSGSHAGGTADEASDLDLYVYYVTEVPLGARSALGDARGSSVVVDDRTHEPGDAWIETASHLVVDVTFRHIDWIEGTIHRILNLHEASVGYSTALWANVLASRIFFDREGWLAALRARADIPYPEALRRAIIAKNHPLLRRGHFSALHLLEKAVVRGDLVSVNHCIARLLASYFEILFALNRVPHPGEKRLLALATARCGVLPAGMADDVAALLGTAGSVNGAVLASTNRLIDALDRVLVQEELIAP